MIWIDTQPAFDAAMERAKPHPTVAVDTEADSLHSYFDKVCLIQLSVPGEDMVIDPLRQIDLARFGDMLADAGVTKILHGADYDLRILHRDFGYTMNNVVDTMVCAQLLGYEQFGLGALLQRHFGMTVDKSHQRADWAMRPLPPQMLDYAATDTRHLIDLAARLRQELEALGRWEWAIEEFGRLEAIRFSEKDDDGEPFRRLKSLGGLDRRTLAVVRELYAWRDQLARKSDRPPFKIIGNDAILEVAKIKPESAADLASIKAVSQYHRNRYARDLLRLVKTAMALPEEELPEKSESRQWIRDKALENRINRLKSARDRIAKELKIDGSILAPRHILTAIAQSGTLDVPAMREWQKKVLGSAFAPLLA